MNHNEVQKRLFTSESVTEGHPDKVCDNIADAVLDAMLRNDPNSRVACECCATTGMVMVMGEVTTNCYICLLYTSGGRVVLVTGGGGSIGSELCRQLAAHDPKMLIIFDIYENNAYDIQQELRAAHPELELIVLIGSVRDKQRVRDCLLYTSGTERAKQIAFNRAGVSASQVKNLKVKLDTDDGRAIYEIEFDAKGYEYDVDVDAVNGNVVDLSLIHIFALVIC